MAHTAVATLPPVADCRWLRAWSELEGATDVRPGTCACVRDGAPRAIDPEECRSCPHWEPAGFAAVATAASGVAALASPVPRIDPVAFVRALTRGVVVLIALLFVALGVIVLASPWAIPVTMTFWLVAVAFGWFGLYGPLPG
jgi:hypothetical protein